MGWTNGRVFLNEILSRLSQGTGLIAPSNSISVCAMGRGGGKAAAQLRAMCSFSSKEQDSEGLEPGRQRIPKAGASHRQKG